jgi:hypothetical protein
MPKKKAETKIKCNSSPPKASIKLILNLLIKLENKNIADMKILIKGGKIIK